MSYNNMEFTQYIKLSYLATPNNDDFPQNNIKNKQQKSRLKIVNSAPPL